MKKIPKTQLKGILQLKPGWLAIATTGLFEDLKNKNLKGHEKEIVYITIQDEQKFKTDQQNKFLHKLIEIYFRSGMFDYSTLLQRPPKDIAELKIDIKNRFGVSAQEIKQRTDLIDLKEGQFVEIEKRVYYLMSWSKYTKTEARQLLDSLIVELIEKGIDIDNEILLYKEMTEKKEVKKQG